ncbi:MAG: transcriptional repressor [Corallococcus sp.]|nr:transcriptional repressor [Corallococcus sp.]MCM1360053.1 transcriptional repressor [Corallococcus sp.]MCM1395610.1 transcriptional repressor [Corallococcus sp.]
MRFSKQREAVYDALCNTTSHPTAAEVYSQVKQAMPNLSLGTVYRNLDELCALGKARRVGVEGSAERFDANMGRHAHFVCTTCGSVADADLSAVRTACNAGEVSRVEVTLYGICNDCLAAKSKR